MAARVLRSSDDADDVVHDVFERVPSALRDSDVTGPGLRSWLYALVRNSSIDVLRRRERAAAAFAATPVAARLEDSCAAVAARDALRDVVSDVGRLPQRQRAALVLTAVEGLPTSASPSTSGPR